MANGNKKTVTMEPPSSWRELSAEQLIYVQSLDRGEMDDIIYRMHIFLHLSGLELCGESYIEEQPEKQTNEAVSDGDATQDASADDLESQLKWMEEVMHGDHRVVVLRKIERPFPLPKGVHLFLDDEDESQESGENQNDEVEDSEPIMFQIPLEQFFEAVRQYTEFVDDPYQLDRIPFETMDIGEHSYQLPYPQITSLTYEQYQNAQTFLGYFWNRAQGIEQEMQYIAKLPKDRREDEDFMAPHLKNLTQWNKDMKMWQEYFMAHILTLGHPAVEEREVLTEAAKKRVEEARKKGEETELSKKDFIKKKFFKTEYTYNATEVDLLGIPQEMRKAPRWLFPILHQNFQSSMMIHKKNFPLLFSGAGGGGISDPMVSQVNTINAVMKWQTYASQQAVRDDNAVSVFAVLNNMTREAKEMEEANKKMKRHSKR